MTETAADLSLRVTGVAAPGLAGIQAFESPFQYWYLLRSGRKPGCTRAR